MDASGYTYSIERVLNERAPESFLEAETILENRDYDLNLVDSGRLEVDGKVQEVFKYEVDDASLTCLYLYNSNGEIGSKVLEPGEDEPSI